MKLDICKAALLAGSFSLTFGVVFKCFMVTRDIHEHTICLQCAQDLSAEFKAKYSKDENNG